MITDKIEVFLQTKENPTLCSTMKDPLNYQEKGFMISKEKAFQRVINNWLQELVVSGELSKRFDFHLRIN